MCSPQDSSMGNKDRAQKNSKEVAILLRGLGVLLVERNIWVRVLLEWMIVLGVVAKAIK